MIKYLRDAYFYYMSGLNRNKLIDISSNFSVLKELKSNYGYNFFYTHNINKHLNFLKQHNTIDLKYFYYNDKNKIFLFGKLPEKDFFTFLKEIINTKIKNDRLINLLYLSMEEIIKEEGYPLNHDFIMCYNITFAANYLEINKPIFPNLIIKPNPVKILDVPKELNYIIKKIKIYHTQNLKISSVKLEGMTHPNCNYDGYYCLGNLSGELINETNIERIVNNVKILDLTKAYYIPEELEVYIK